MRKMLALVVVAIGLAMIATGVIATGDFESTPAQVEVVAMQQAQAEALAGMPLSGYSGLR